MEGTMKSFVFVQYCINLEWEIKVNLAGDDLLSQEGKGVTHDMEASDTLILGRSKSSLSRELSSLRRRNFRSAMDCFLFLTSPPARIS